MATKRVNITVDPNVYEWFVKTELKGIKISTWINQQIKQFVEQEEKNNSKQVGFN